MKKYLIAFFLLIFSKNFSQDSLNSVMTLSEYLVYVKKYHPLVKQASLLINESEGNLLKARGTFDPVIEVDFDNKKFKGKEYYNKLNSVFKIPTYYGIEFKANLEDNSGIFLNPENNLNNEKLYSVGLSVSLLQGLLTNNRMASLKQSKYFLDKAKEDQQIMVNEILYNASITYFKWLKYYNEKLLYDGFLENALFRFNSTKKAFLSGDKAAIDTLEAGITLNNRKLSLEKARIKLTKSSLELSNFLWLENNIPVEIKDNIIPDISTLDYVDKALNIALFNNENFDIENHPKIKSLGFKIKSLDVDKRLKKNNLLPKLDVQYNFISDTPSQLNSFDVDNFKAGINFKLPLFLRKERGDLKLANTKLQDAKFENDVTRITIKNNLSALQQELDSYFLQNNYLDNIVNDYNTLLKAEERKFFLGESSLFLVNNRERLLIENKLKSINLENEYFNTKAKLFKTAVLNINQ